MVPRVSIQPSLTLSQYTQPWVANSPRLLDQDCKLGIYRAAPIRPGSCVHPGHRLCGPSLYIFCTTGKLAEQPGRSTVHALSSQWRPLPPQVQTRGKQHVSELPLCSRRPHRTFIPLSPSCRAIVMAIVQVEARSLCSWNSMPFFIGVRSPPPLCSRRPHRTSIPLPSRARSGPHPPFPISYHMFVRVL